MFFKVTKQINFVYSNIYVGGIWINVFHRNIHREAVKRTCKSFEKINPAEILVIQWDVEILTFIRSERGFTSTLGEVIQLIVDWGVRMNIWS